MYGRMNDQIISLFNKDEILSERSIAKIIYGYEEYNNKEDFNSFTRTVNRHLKELVKAKNPTLERITLKTALDFNYKDGYKKNNANYFILSDKFKNYNLFNAIITDINSKDVNIQKYAQRNLLKRKLSNSQIIVLCNKIKSETIFSEVCYYYIYAIKNSVLNINKENISFVCEILSNFVLNKLKLTLFEVKQTESYLELMAKSVTSSSYLFNNSDSDEPVDFADFLRFSRKYIVDILFQLDFKDIILIIETEINIILDLEKNKTEFISKIKSDRLERNNTPVIDKTTKKQTISLNLNILSKEFSPEEVYAKQIDLYINTFLDCYIDFNIDFKQIRISQLSFEFYNLFKKFTTKFPNSEKLYILQDTFLEMIDNK